MIKNKVRFYSFVVLAACILGGLLLSPIRSAQADSSVIGPYTEILIPLEDLPALNEGLVYNPEISLEPYEEYDTVLIQILSVLDDPREVPLARFAHNGASGVVSPTSGDLDKMARYDLKTINVYIRSRFLVDSLKPDPFLAPEPAGYDTNWPAINLYVEALADDYEGITRFPCAKMEYADGTEPYQLPAGIDGGAAVGKDGLYDPRAYAPPKPWYYSEDPMFEPGEVREGWVSCLAPDVPLEQLEIDARYSYINEQDIVVVNEHKLEFGLYVPDASELEIIGLTPADLPADLEECAQMEHCLPQDLISLDSCKWAAKDAGLEKGLCSFYSMINSDGDFVDFTSRVFYTNIQEEPTHNSYQVWSFMGAGSFTKNTIRLEDIPLSFTHNDHGMKTVRGSAIFYNPRIDQSDRYDGYMVGWETKYTFISRVKIEPYGMTQEDLVGYRLIEIGTSVRALIDHEGSIQRGVSNTVYPSTLYSQSDDLFEWTITSDIELYEILDVSTFLQQGKGFLQPGTALINLYPHYEYDYTYFLEGALYPAKVINIHSPNLVSKTTMCDVVDCVEYWDEDDTYQDVIKPPRDVPVMCAGEWANNIIVDDLKVVNPMEYIGSPWGTGADVSVYHREFFESWNRDRRFSYIFLYDIRFIGGATPWWIASNRFGQIDSIYGHTVDIETGQETDDGVHILPYYAMIENDLTNGYFVRGPKNFGISFDKSGWMGEIIDQKVLAFSDLYCSYEKYGLLDEKNTGFLFLEEGPMWIQNCQRDLVPALSSQVLYAPEEANLPSESDVSRHSMTSLLPGMTYPADLSVVDGQIYSLGEHGDTYTFEKFTGSDISHYIFTVKDVGIVRGKIDRSVVYVPTEDKFYPAEKSPNWNNELFFANNNAFVIPPDTTYVEIRVGVDRLEISEGSYCGIEDEDLQLVYPGYLPINGVIERKPGELAICRDDDFSFRMAFLFPSLDFELENMLFSIRGGAQEPWNFWRLVEE